MEGLRQYALSLLCTSLICAIGCAAMPEGYRKAARFLCGLLMALILLSPLTDLDVDGLLRQLVPKQAEARAYIRQGEAMALEVASGCIEQQIRAYILDKATALGAQIQVTVAVKQVLPPVPETVTIHGSVTPEIIRQLSESIERELGIAKEDQRWIG